MMHTPLLTLLWFIQNLGCMPFTLLAKATNILTALIRVSAGFCSKNYLFMAVSSQQKADPRRIFPPESFCSINEGKPLIKKEKQSQTSLIIVGLKLMTCSIRSSCIAKTAVGGGNHQFSRDAIVMC